MRRVLLSYILDYAIIVVFVAAFTALDKVDGFKQPFALSNISLQYPYAVRDRVPAWAAAVAAAVAPLVLMAAWIVAQGVSSKERARSMFWQMNCALLGLALSVAGALVITDIFKNVTGRPRPDVIARCMPPLDAMDPQPAGLVTVSICTQTDASILRDGWRSFPSGHTSIAFSGFGFFSLWIAGRTRVLDGKGEVWKSLLALIPLIAASLIGLSRIQDARHHPFDVLFSAALGMLMAWGGYRQYYPSLASLHAGWAYPIRSWGSNPERQEFRPRGARDGNQGQPAYELETTGSASHHPWTTLPDEENARGALVKPFSGQHRS